MRWKKMRHIPAIERDYQQLVLKLIQEKAQLAEHMQKKQTDMMDYLCHLGASD